MRKKLLIPFEFTEAQWKFLREKFSEKAIRHVLRKGGLAKLVLMRMRLP